jgi:hypothetical protein
VGNPAVSFCISSASGTRILLALPSTTSAVTFSSPPAFS